MKQTLLILSFFCVAAAQAQVKMTADSVFADATITFDFQSAGNISIDAARPKVDFSKAAFVLKGNVDQNFMITGSQPIALGSLTVNTSGATYTLNQGTLNISKNLLFENGIFATTSNSKLVYSGSDNLVPPQLPNISYVSGKLFIKGSGQRTFPIGNTLGYLPVTLEDIKAGDANTEIGFEAIVGDPNIAPSLLTPDIKDVFTTNYWMMTNGNSGSYTGSILQLSLNSAGSFFSDGDPIVLEVDTDGKLNNLSGIIANPDVTSLAETTSKGQKYALGKSETVTVNIHRVITPNSDGQNDYLYIDGIDFYTDNTVKLVDRWGVVHYEKANFKNFSTTNPADFDFGKLSNGNYICVVELGSGPKVKPKMISVVK